MRGRKRGAQIVIAVLVALLLGQLLATSPTSAESNDQIDQAVVDIQQTEDLPTMVDILPDEVVAEMPAQVNEDFTMEPAPGESSSGAQTSSSQSVATNSFGSVGGYPWAPCSPPASGGRQCPLPGYPPPFGLLSSNARNDFGLPDLPVPGGNYCTDAPDRIPFLSDFRSSCYQHDLAYVFTPVPRSDVDRRFLDNMKQSCRDHHGWWNPLRYVCYGIAYIYYFAVRLFGSSHFGTTLIPGFNAEYVPPSTTTTDPSSTTEPVDPPDPCGYNSQTYASNREQPQLERPNCP